jgi:hypothetical protein
MKLKKHSDSVSEESDLPANNVLPFEDECEEGEFEGEEGELD